MKTQIYYFSATGNCLAVARQIAARTEAELKSIPEAVSADSIWLEADRVGIVFPAYLTPVMGLPLIVERFVKKIGNAPEVRFFAVCTCGGYPFANALSPLETLRRCIQNRGGDLLEAYSVRLPMNNLDYAHIPVPISSDLPGIIDRAKRKTDRIANRIQKGKRTQLPFFKWMVCRLIGLIYRAFRRPAMEVLGKKAQEAYDGQKKAAYYLPLTDRSIAVHESCTGCGTCVKVCPAQNIVLKNGRPYFQHRCEMCFACDEWCPAGAIRHWSRAKGIKYHYPSVCFSVIMAKEESKKKGSEHS